MLKRLFIALSWAIFVIGLVVALSAFFVPQGTIAYDRGGWMKYSSNPPGFEYVP